ncbi:MAG TPA: chromosomal replication initiator protein DnaA [Aeromicrobium sp.]|nr:chromosomal replication initiator protein DnaA [Aeromicrobium sp.]
MSDEPAVEADIADHWARAVEQLNPGARIWAGNATPLSLHDDILIVAVRDDISRAQLESRVRPVLEQQLSATIGSPIRLIVTIDPEQVQDHFIDVSTKQEIDTSMGVGGLDSDDDLEDEVTDESEFVPSWAVRPQVATSNRNLIAEARLNPRYLFENFVIGASNRFAHAAAVAVAEAPGNSYNPLVIHGESGLGKTHLLHAIGNYVLNLYPSARVRYVNTEEFTNDVINAIGERKTAELQRKYREVDVLLVDDIQFLERKEATQSEFFHTFNALHNANKQIVMTSDRPPKQLKTLEERMLSRFAWGLQTETLPPDLETRIAILRKKAAAERLTVPADVLEFIASRVQTNIRELEGALIRTTAFANLQRVPVDLALAHIVLKDLVAEGDEPEITASLIMAQTAAYSDFSIDDLCGPNRTRNLVLARQIAMYLCRELTNPQLSLPKIGEEFGGRDHTTVLHAEKKIRTLMAEKHAVYNQVTELTNRIRNQARGQS